MADISSDNATNIIILGACQIIAGVCSFIISIAGLCIGLYSVYDVRLAEGYGIDMLCAITVGNLL